MGKGKRTYPYNPTKINKKRKFSVRGFFWVLLHLFLLVVEILVWVIPARNGAHGWVFVVCFFYAIYHIFDVSAYTKEVGLCSVIRRLDFIIIFFFDKLLE